MTADECVDEIEKVVIAVAMMGAIGRFDDAPAAFGCLLMEKVTQCLECYREHQAAYGTTDGAPNAL